MQLRVVGSGNMQIANHVHQYHSMVTVWAQHFARWRDVLTPAIQCVIH